jgi:hypothetical protein
VSSSSAKSHPRIGNAWRLVRPPSRPSPESNDTTDEGWRTAINSNPALVAADEIRIDLPEGLRTDESPHE